MSPGEAPPASISPSFTSRTYGQMAAACCLVLGGDPLDVGVREWVGSCALLGVGLAGWVVCWEAARQCVAPHTENPRSVLFTRYGSHEALALRRNLSPLLYTKDTPIGCVQERQCSRFVQSGVCCVLCMI